ncbi:MAG: hypothetical protein IJW98_00040 [Clostridia bacterium]|nr:hypothetical protein [Clostridia bacterium]
MNDQQNSSLKVSIRLSEGNFASAQTTEPAEDEVVGDPSLKVAFFREKPPDEHTQPCQGEATDDPLSPGNEEIPAAEPASPPTVPAPFGQPYETVGALGCEMLERIRRGRAPDLTKLDALLRERQISGYLSRVEPVDYSLQEAVFTAETEHQIRELTKTQRLLHLYTVAFLIADNKHFVADGTEIADIDGLNAYMKSLLDASYRDLERFCHRMVSYDGVLDPQLEAWLTVLGKADLLDAWRLKIRG